MGDEEGTAVDAQKRDERARLIVEKLSVFWYHFIFILWGCLQSSRHDIEVVRKCIYVVELRIIDMQRDSRQIRKYLMSSTMKVCMGRTKPDRARD